MIDFAETFVNEHKGADFEEFKLDLIRQISIEPTFNETTYEKATESQLKELLMNDFTSTLKRRMTTIKSQAMPILRRIYEEQGDNVENIYVPITDGIKGFNVPVSLKRAVETDGAEIQKSFSKVLMLLLIDENWKEHLREMDELRHSVQNATYEQKDPLLIYKFESYELFRKMLDKTNLEVLSVMFKAFIPMPMQ